MSDVPTSEVLEVMQGLQIDLAESKKDNDRLRLENARLEVIVYSLREGMRNTITQTSCHSTRNNIVECLKSALDKNESPSTALAEFLGPTIETINYLLGSGETTAFKRARLEKEKIRLTSPIGGGK